MFTDGRSKKVVFAVHCFLNQNAISDGTAVWPAACKELVQQLLDADVGIVQMPCPELCCLGLDRGNPAGADSPVTVENTRIRKAMGEPQANARLMLLADYVMLQVDEYQKYGFEICGIIGANRSPNCGVDTTSDSDVEISGKGVFMQELCRRLAERRLEIPFVGLKGSDNIAEKLKPVLRR